MLLPPPPLFFVSLQKQCANPYHRASYRAVRCAFTSVITHPHLCLQAGCYTVLLTIRVVSWAGRTACCGTGCSRPGCLGTERVTGQGVYWNTVFSSAAAAVQLQYSRNIVLLCGCFPRPALNFTLNVLPQLYSFRPPPPSLSLSFLSLCASLPHYLPGVILKSELHVATTTPAGLSSPAKTEIKKKRAGRRDN